MGRRAWIIGASRALVALLPLSGAGCSLATSTDGLTGQPPHKLEAADATAMETETMPDAATIGFGSLLGSQEGGDASPLDTPADSASSQDVATTTCFDASVCSESSCTNGQKDGSETAVDCGGGCTPCAAGQACLVAADCTSKACAITPRPGESAPPDAGSTSDGEVAASPLEDADAAPLERTCQAARCDDKILNGDESDVDCGGSCQKCPSGAGCNSWIDCQGGVCNDKRCAPSTCSDGVINGSETGLDCGGNCSPCPAGQRCLSASDCSSKVCKDDICEPPTCSDGIKNGWETDVDCGGDSCPKCATNRHCMVDSDCAFASCKAGICRYGG